MREAAYTGAEETAGERAYGATNWSQLATEERV